MKYLFFIFFLTIPLKDIHAQANDAEAALYNVGFGGLSGAIGAIINKKPDDKFGKVFLKGLWQGALGGYVTFESKRILRIAGREGDWKLYWISNLVNAAGSSIKENAANNKDFWDQWNISIGFNRIEFHTKDAFSVRYKVMPATAIYTIAAFSRFKFDGFNSLKSGHFVFEQNNPDFNYVASASPGYILFNTPIMNQRIKSNDRTYNQTLTHEIIHLYQNNDFLVFNSFYDQKVQTLFKHSNFMQKVNNYMYYDIHLIPKLIVTGFEYYRRKEYYDSYIEHEAGYYSNTLF